MLSWVKWNSLRFTKNLPIEFKPTCGIALNRWVMQRAPLRTASWAISISAFEWPKTTFCTNVCTCTKYDYRNRSKISKVVTGNQRKYCKKACGRTLNAWNTVIRSPNLQHRQTWKPFEQYRRKDLLKRSNQNISTYAGESIAEICRNDLG